jgi:hypothetical protein
MTSVIQINESKATIMIGWDDVPHLDEETKAELLRGTPPHLREARSKGIPSLGAGAIYPVPEEDIKVSPFRIPPYWPKAYALDVGWNRTAALWGALDRDTDTWYLYSEHYRGQAEPSVHAQAIKARGDWIYGCIDPAARGRAQDDGRKLMSMYTSEGLKLALANNAREAGILQTLQRLSTGRLKVFSTLSNWFKEYRIYRRDENGKVVKKNDHLMDDTRYLVMSGQGIAKTEPVGTPARGYVPVDAIAGY